MGEERKAYGVWLEILNEGDRFEDLGVDGKIISQDRKCPQSEIIVTLSRKHKNQSALINLATIAARVIIGRCTPRIFPWGGGG
jgi:hypothetical protein